MKTVFFGTPAVAVPFLELLAKRAEVAGVVSQPDKPSGRKLEISATPVKAKALELGLPVHQPQRPADLDLSADLAVVVAYGRLLKPKTLNAFKLGALNVHFSLLPKYRGAAPVQWSLVNGETKTGVTLFWLDEGMDTGPILLQKEMNVDPADDAGTLLEKLTKLGVTALDEALTQLAAGKVVRQPQKGEASLAPLIKREDAALTFQMTAQAAHGKVRGFRLWPKAHFPGLIVLKTALDSGSSDKAPGTILDVDRDKGILVQFGSRSRLWFLTVQPEGKSQMSAVEFLNGLRLRPGELLF
jgi:methionyl-tRNA formyltransferase